MEQEEEEEEEAKAEGAEFHFWNSFMNDLALFPQFPRWLIIFVLNIIHQGGFTYIGFVIDKDCWRRLSNLFYLFTFFFLAFSFVVFNVDLAC